MSNRDFLSKILSLFLSGWRTASFTRFELKTTVFDVKTDFNDAVSERIQSPCLISTKSNKTPKFPKKCCFHLTGSVRTVKKPPRVIPGGIISQSSFTLPWNRHQTETYGTITALRSASLATIIGTAGILIGIP